MRIHNKLYIDIPYLYILTSGAPPGNSVIIQRPTSIVYYNIGVYLYCIYSSNYTGSTYEIYGRISVSEFTV